MSKKAAKRRRRQAERKKRTGLPRGGEVLAFAPPGMESPGDRHARDSGDDWPGGGGSVVREPRRPFPKGPLQGAVALEAPQKAAKVEAVAEVEPDETP